MTTKFLKVGLSILAVLLFNLATTVIYTTKVTTHSTELTGLSTLQFYTFVWLGTSILSGLIIGLIFLILLDSRISVGYQALGMLVVSPALMSASHLLTVKMFGGDIDWQAAWGWFGVLWLIHIVYFFVLAYVNDEMFHKPRADALLVITNLSSVGIDEYSTFVHNRNKKSKNPILIVGSIDEAVIYIDKYRVKNIFVFDPECNLIHLYDKLEFEENLYVYTKPITSRSIKIMILDLINNKKITRVVERTEEVEDFIEFVEIAVNDVNNE